ARSVVAMLTEHRLEDHFRILCRIFKGTPVFYVSIAAVVAVDPQPVHFTAVDDFLAANKRYVVLYITCHHASTTTDTSIQVDRHCPVVIAIFVALPHRQFTRLYLVIGRLPCCYLRIEIRLHEFRILPE